MSSALHKLCYRPLISYDFLVCLPNSHPEAHKPSSFSNSMPPTPAVPIPQVPGLTCLHAPPRTQALTRSFTCTPLRKIARSPTHLPARVSAHAHAHVLAYLRAYLRTRALTRSLTCASIRALARSPARLPAHLSAHSRAHPLAYLRVYPRYRALTRAECMRTRALRT